MSNDPKVFNCRRSAGNDAMRFPRSGGQSSGKGAHRCIRERIAGVIILLTVGWVSTACGQTVQLVNAFPSLSFRQPVFLTHSGDGTDRMFVVQQNGLIKVFSNDSTVASASTFLDISKKLSASDGEEGLLGLAFDPHFAENGYFYIDYTAPNPLHTVVARFHLSPGDPDRADSLSEFTVLTVNQPYTNHNGGMLVFGADGYLYIGLGDGGSGGDPQGNAQNRARLLGKILRIDVSDTTATMHYRIPADNPFAGNSSGYREEIWAYGLRNPWRFSFDESTGRLWVGDVGQDAREEVDIVEKGKNYGWNIMEGTACYNPPSGCDTAGLTMPIKDYDHSLGEAITGGYVYHGARRADLDGAYIYADYGSGRIWMLRWENGHLTADTQLLDSPYAISSFGVDQDNELYILSYDPSANTSIYRFARVSLGVPDGGARGLTPRRVVLNQNYPNPFNPTTVVRGQWTVESEIRLSVFDLSGREVAVLASGRYPAGTYSFRFDAGALASGAYFYELRAAGAVIVRKMMVVK
jgi:glucose/arabinose dehydrogenase